MATATPTMTAPRSSLSRPPALSRGLHHHHLSPPALPTARTRRALRHACGAATTRAEAGTARGLATASSASDAAHRKGGGPATRTARKKRGASASLAARATAGDDDDRDASSSNNNSDPRDSWDEEDDDPELRARLEAERAADAAVERLLAPAWRGLKDAARRELSSSAADASDDDDESTAARRAAQQDLDNMSLRDALEGDHLLRSLAESELGPVLESMGLPRSQALPFLYDLVRIAAVVQLAAAALLFYGAEFFAGLDSGGAWRCVCGLGFGYLARLVIPVEALAWPLYDGLVKAATGGKGYYALPPAPLLEGEEERGERGERGAAAGGEAAEKGGAAASGAAGRFGEQQRQQPKKKQEQEEQQKQEYQRGQAQTALVRLAALAAGCALAPPLLLGWTPEESAWQFALPALAGALAFDAAYLAALVVKLREVEEGDGGGGGGW